MNIVPAELTAGTEAYTVATSAGFWVAVGGIVLLLLVGSSLRVVSEHERVLVSRLGRVVRVVGPGMVFRLPGLERCTTVSLRPVHLELVVSAISRDGVPVRLMATGLCRITDPSQSTAASPDPLSATATELESRLAKEVAHLDLAALLPSREEFESRLPREVTTVTAGWGVEVDEIEVRDIETRLTADLLRSVQRQPEAGDG